MLNTKEFNQLSEKIINSIYRLNPNVRDLYDIHVNYIDDSWQIDFLPLNNKLPVIKIDTFVEQGDRGEEVLKIIPSSLTELPKKLRFSEASSYDLCMNYVELFEFILALYDFEYQLN